MNLSRLFLAIVLIYIFNGCREEKCTLIADEVYINYLDHEIDSSITNCEIEIENNELYNSMNFNDTSSVEPGGFRYRSHFSHSKFVIKGKEYDEICLFVSKNATLTYSTNPPTIICNFRYDTELKSLKIFDIKSKKFLDFRQKQGMDYFEKCLRKFSDEHNTK